MAGAGKGQAPGIPTTGRIGRLARSIGEEAGQQVLMQLMRDVDRFTSASSGWAKAAWLSEAMTWLEELVGREAGARIMERCGRQCCGPARGERTRELLTEVGSLEGLLARLNQVGLGGGRLRLLDEQTISAGYDRCYCGQVKETREPFPTTTYCRCSAGWYKELFETALGKPVAVEVVQTIVCGADTCEFLIRI